jgi:hypothetical protein
MNSSPQLRSAVDAVRCLYLARVTERAGHHEAARRWYAKAAAWMGENLPGKSGKLKAGSSLLTTEN